MAGGEGAKERRRLKRLAAQEEKNKSVSSIQTTTIEEKNKSIRFHGNKRESKNNDVERRTPGNKNNRYQKTKSNNASNDKKPKIKKPKIKKPKHLKRKLEQASKEATKEAIQMKIEQFETKKKFYSKRNPQNKRQKTTKFVSVDSSKNSNDDRIITRLNEINDKISPLQRNDIEIKKPSITENANIETVNQIVPTEATIGIREHLSTSSNPKSEQSKNILSEVTTKEEKSNQTSDDSKSSDDHSCTDSDDSSKEDIDDNEPVRQRQRGKRRRGRQDTATKVKEMEGIKKKQDVDKVENKLEDDIKNEKKRYCIGRKPVTDFVVGESHKAKVVYVKPFGVFFDIGCHSDAFCHVSRLSDDFVESPEMNFKEGDVVAKARIVEIDRKQKRITISLQSDARIEDERLSIEARKSRKEKRKKSKSKTSNSSHNHYENGSEFDSVTVSKEPFSNKVSPEPVNKKIDPSTMTPAELKRARKLARRAERRSQAEKLTQDS